MQEKITKFKYNLKPGTIIGGIDGDIILTSEYDSCHKWYTAHTTEVSEDGELIELDNEIFVTPADLLGKFIYTNDYTI